jgi:hypothetical protein
VFIFWALLGVGTVTTLISSMSHFSILLVCLTSFPSFIRGLFVSLQTLTTFGDLLPSRQALSGEHTSCVRAIASHASKVYFASPWSVTFKFYTCNIFNRYVESLFEALSDTQKHIEGKLEALPHQVLHHVRTFNENVQYLLHAEVDKFNNMPDGLKKLLNDVAGKERISNGIKQEVIRDQDARRVSQCFCSLRNCKFTPWKRLY